MMHVYTQAHRQANFFFGIFFFSFLPSLFAQNGQQKKQLDAYRLGSDEEVVFDGRLDEDFWNKIDPASDFLQQQPQEGNSATEQTEVRIAFDEEHIYMGVILYDSDPSGIKAYQKRRDKALVSDDRLLWIFDTFNDQRNAYFFEVNPNGLRGDGTLRGQGSGIDKRWDGLWHAQTHIGNFGWTVEVRIPFQTLNFDPTIDRWGINFLRIIVRKNEWQLWTGHRRNQGLFRPQNAGMLTGLSDISQGLGLEVIPYGIVNASKERSIKSEIRPDAGLDVNYSITPSLKASLTFNTDFAEAEVDQRQVNLTRFPLQFPEQRDFFLEGANIYEFAPASEINPFFSRRIGLIEGEQIPITYGARMMGNAGDYNLAFLHVRTGEKDDVNPENFSVARIKRNIGTESTIGVIYTRRATDDPPNVMPTLQDRHTFGSDLELGTSNFLGGKNLQFQSFFVFHNPAFSDDDSTSIFDRSTRGFRLNYPNQPWSAHISYREFGKAYDPAVGFTQRNGFRRFNPRIGFAPQLTQSDLIHQIGWNLWFEHLTDMDFTTLTQSIRLTLLEIITNSNDQIELNIVRDFERLRNPFDIKRDGTIIIPVDEYVTWGLQSSVQSANYRRVSLGLDLEIGGFWSGKYFMYGGQVTMRPFPGIELIPEYIHTNINLAEGNFSTDMFRLKADIDLTTSLFITTNIQYENLSNLLGINNRLRWTITPGSDVYLVYNHNWIESPMQRFRTTQSSGALKVSYNHRF